ncbi:hypothetical protein [Dethiothermospora halolimnae]
MGNDEMIEQDFKVNENTATWIDLLDSKSYEFDFKYYDKEGNLIEQD